MTQKEFDGKYGVLPMTDGTGKIVYSIMKFDGESFPESSIYLSKEAAQADADFMNGVKRYKTPPCVRKAQKAYEGRIMNFRHRVRPDEHAQLTALWEKLVADRKD